MRNKNTDTYLEILKEVVLDNDVRSYAGLSSHNLSETLYKSNLLPGHISVTEDLFTPVYTSYELLPVQKAVNICRIIDYYLWAYDKKLTESEKLKGKRNSKTLTLLLSGITEGTYELDFVNEKLCIKSNLSYGYTKKYSYGRLYPIKASISHISREFRYHLFKDLYNAVDIVNAHPSILYNYAISHNIDICSLGELVNNRELFYNKIKENYGGYLKINPKKLTLISLNMNKTDFKSDVLNSLTRDLNKIRDQLYEEFYLNNSEFRSAIDLRCNDSSSKIDVIMKTQSLFCLTRETECIMSFKDFYLSNIPPELQKNSSFIPFFDGLYIYSDSISYLNVSNMKSNIQKVDLEGIIEKYNGKNTIKFHNKPIEMEDKLIPQEVFNNIQYSIDLVEHMNYKEILNEFRVLNLSEELVNSLNEILNSSNQREITFDYNQLTCLQSKVKTMYHKLVHHLITRNK